MTADTTPPSETAVDELRRLRDDGRRHELADAVGCRIPSRDVLAGFAAPVADLFE